MHKWRLQFLAHVHLEPYETYNVGDVKVMTIIDHLQREFQHVVFDNNNGSYVLKTYISDIWKYI
jgi:hypothetical protein